MVTKMDSQINFINFINQLPSYYAKGLAGANKIGLTPDVIRMWSPFLIPAASKATSANVINPELFEQGLRKVFDGIADLLAAGK